MCIPSERDFIGLETVLCCNALSVFSDGGNWIELDIVLCIPSQRKLDWRLHCFVSLLFYRGGGFPGREAENQCGGHPGPPPPGGDL